MPWHSTTRLTTIDRPQLLETPTTLDFDLLIQMQTSPAPTVAEQDTGRPTASMLLDSQNGGETYHVSYQLPRRTKQRPISRLQHDTSCKLFSINPTDNRYRCKSDVNQ